MALQNHQEKEKKTTKIQYNAKSNFFFKKKQEVSLRITALNTFKIK